MGKKETKKTLNDLAWEQLFEKHDILNKIAEDGLFKISAKQIKKFREPRLMVKFDRLINLPKIFDKNKLAILPITRGDYVISDFNAYYKLEPDASLITQVSLPDYIQSLDYNKVISESIALNCAFATGIIEDFLEDEEILATVSGRMGSGSFEFNIANLTNTKSYRIDVDNSQIEIDAAYEGRDCLALIEAKLDLADNFLIRQLYYPFRLWQSRVEKVVRPVFLVYSNSIYKLYEYKFQDPNDYNSLVLVKQKNYALEDTKINIVDIENIINKVKIISEPEVPFPQADVFKRVINLCELLNEQNLNKNDVTEQYAFDIRQADYYTNAARYLGLVKKEKQSGSSVYCLTKLGRRIIKQNFKQRQLAYCELILSHKVFYTTLHSYLLKGIMPNENEIVQIMKKSDLYKVGSDDTFERRSSTVRGWINWIVGLINDY